MRKPDRDEDIERYLTEMEKMTKDLIVTKLSKELMNAIRESVKDIIECSGLLKDLKNDVYLKLIEEIEKEMEKGGVEVING